MYINIYAYILRTKVINHKILNVNHYLEEEESNRLEGTGTWKPNN